MGWRLQSCLAPLGGVDELYIYIYIRDTSELSVSDLSASSSLWPQGNSHG